MTKSGKNKRTEKDGSDSLMVLYSVLTKLNPNQLVHLYNDLLTESEALMLAKRVQIACLLIEGKSYLHIQHELGVTANTVAQIQKVLKSAGKGFRFANEYLTSIGESVTPTVQKQSSDKHIVVQAADANQKEKFFGGVVKKFFRSTP